jgi:hypothetical protein
MSAPTTTLLESVRVCMQMPSLCMQMQCLHVPCCCLHERNEAAARAWGRIKFDDLHSSGLFTWTYLHDLGAEKYARMKQYLKRLKAAGGSRSPPTPTGRSQHSKCGSGSRPPATSR